MFQLIILETIQAHRRSNSSWFFVQIWEASNLAADVRASLLSVLCKLELPTDDQCSEKTATWIPKIRYFLLQAWTVSSIVKCANRHEFRYDMEIMIFFSIFGLVILISCNMIKWLHPWLISIVLLWRFLIPRTKSIAMFWLKWALVSGTRMLCFFFPP